MPEPITCSPARRYRRAAADRSVRLAAMLAVTVALVLSACQPTPVLPAPPFGSVPGPSTALLTVGPGPLTRGTTVAVGTSGCDEDFQYVEVRLVTGSGTTQRGVAMTTVSGGETADLEVPMWAATGPAEVEASCNEPDFSMASDGADVLRFDFPSVPVTIADSPAATAEPTLSVPAVVSDGALTVSGSGCGGRVLVGVAPGLIPSATRFHYGRRLVTAAPDGSWSTTLQLGYHAGEFSDPIVPGSLSVFAVCEGWWYSPAPFEVSTASPAPAVHLVGPFPAVVGLTQCPTYNTVSILAAAEMPSGEIVGVGHHEAGRGFGEHLYPVDVPAGAVRITWYASCHGADPSFVYTPASINL